MTNQERPGHTLKPSGKTSTRCPSLRNSVWMSRQCLSKTSLHWSSTTQLAPKVEQQNLCFGANGIINDLKIYTGKIEPCPSQPNLGASRNMVLRPLQSVPQGVWHRVYIDNSFNSVSLQITLWKQGITCLETVRINRLRGCALTSDKELTKKGK